MTPPQFWPRSLVGAPLTPAGLSAFEQVLRGSQVLSVYIDGADPDTIHERAWRSRMRDELRRLESSIDAATSRERATFRACMDLVGDIAAPYPRWLGPGAGFAVVVSSGGTRHSTVLSKAVCTRAYWQRGMRLAPYVYGMPPQRRSLVVVTRPLQLLLFEYHAGSMRRLSANRLHSPRREARSERLHTQTIVREVASAAGTETAVLLLGCSPIVDHIVSELQPITDRLLWDRREVTRVRVKDLWPRVSEGITALESVRRQREIDSLLENRSSARTALGADAVALALARNAVGQFYFSSRLTKEAPETIEELLRGALEQGARLGPLDGIAASRLDGIAGGVAASLVM